MYLLFGGLIMVTLFLLQTKHLIMDWLWQTDYELNNKGRYFHPGGIKHSLKHALGTGLCFLIGMGLIFPLWLVALIAVVDFLIHYHIDYAKDHLNHYWELNPSKKNFYRLMGLDQYAHQLCYLGYFLLPLLVVA